MKYMRNGLKDKYGFLELQDKILEIAVYIDDFCRKNTIDYCLMGGSALGAKRHGGFIPWDDDLDIFMTLENYERFRECFGKEGDHDRFYLQEWGLSDGMVTISKVRMNCTSYIEENLEDWDIHHGIFVDIFILHTCPDSLIKRIHQWFWAKYVITKGLSLREQNRHSGFKSVLIRLAGLLPDRFLVNYGLRQVYRFRDKKTECYCNFMGKAVLKKGIYKKEWFENNTYVPFETVELKAPAKLHEFLTERFGDYMVIPSDKQIKWEQHTKKWDLNEQTMISNEYKDEKKLI